MTDSRDSYRGISLFSRQLSALEWVGLVNAEIQCRLDKGSLYRDTEAGSTMITASMTYGYPP